MTVGLSLGADRWRLIRRGGGVAWTPAALFADGAQGFFADPTDGLYAFSDTAGTSAAPVDGAVARLDAPPGSPVAASFTNATVSQQPVLRADGLELDGVDDRLEYPDDPALRFGTTDFTIAFACMANDTLGVENILSKRGGAIGGTLAGWDVRQVDADLAIGFDPGVGTPANFFTLVPSAFVSGVSAYGLIAINRAANTARARANGVDSPPVTIPAGDISGTLPLVIGAAANGVGQFYSGTIGRLLAIDKLLSPEDTALVEQWLQGGGA